MIRGRRRSSSARPAAVVAVLVLAAAAACADPDGRPGPSASPSATVSSSPTPSATAAADRFTVVASGDFLVHPGVWTRARLHAQANGSSEPYDFAPMLEQIRPLISGADLAICHMEVPFGPDGSAPVGFPLFSAPPQVAVAMGTLGYDSCSTASNHALDRGEEGVARTLDAFDAAGVRHAGTARSQEEHDAPTILDAAGVPVAHLSYTYGHNNVRPASKPWLVNVLADDSILADARAAREAGAAVVVVSLHWGNEYRSTPTEAQVALARELMDDGGVDLVIGHHAHVVQPIEAFGDRFVVYGMGNVIAAASHDFAGGASREGIVPEFTFTRGQDGRYRVTRIEITPIYTDPLGGLHTTDVAAALAEPPPGADVARLRRARDRTIAIVYAKHVPRDVVVIR